MLAWAADLLVFVASFRIALRSFYVVMTWLDNSTGGSLHLAVLMHLAFNVALTLSIMPLHIMMALLAIAYLIFALIVTIIAGPDTLSRRSSRVVETTTPL